MHRYVLPLDFEIDLDGCTVNAQSITLPYPIRYADAERLVFLATVQRFRSAGQAWPQLGRTPCWVYSRWRRYGLPVVEPPTPTPAPASSPLEEQLRGLLSDGRNSLCPRCRQLADLIEHAVCFAAPIRLKEACRWVVLDALQRASGDRTAAAKALGISRTTLHKWCKDFGIPPHSKQPAHSAGRRAP